MESQQEVKTPGGKGSQDKGELRHYPSHGRTTGPERSYCYSFRITISTPTRLPNGFMPFSNQKISDQELTFFKIPGSSKEKKSIKGENNTSFNQRPKESDPMIQKLFHLVKRYKRET
ncbi:hypothetical protein O181_006092 [Austropuccinia psidii MF-1]|uniref:Uncharacterized protein n=1 Tax=Austropuccinia psidii MF-1 TaxID=1389203 RepID=A0A9Q3GHA1_9BASI|nr:hypothetical protein [Austropuccinia psidii MF-1]